jgi:hypothetical protein
MRGWTIFLSGICLALTVVALILGNSYLVHLSNGGLLGYALVRAATGK